MNCNGCEFFRSDHCCDVTKTINPKVCRVPEKETFKSQRVCYNCKHWIGGGDWGLSCDKHYDIASTDGTTAACADFEDK